MLLCESLETSVVGQPHPSKLRINRMGKSRRSASCESFHATLTCWILWRRNRENISCPSNLTLCRVCRRGLRLDAPFCSFRFSSQGTLLAGHCNRVQILCALQATLRFWRRLMPPCAGLGPDDLDKVDTHMLDGNLMPWVRGVKCVGAILPANWSERP